MSYLAIYRRFRPNEFDSVIGQEHIVRILKNQIKSNQIGHAYLFSGARGIGKTTLARIFAKAINCEHLKDGNPCGECESCKSIEKNLSLNLIEMDAASNNSVDDIRQLRENVQFPPIGGRYKVYIIDEVHMLSQGAFNALLKTLEEPPKHAIFILATTELHKIPETILSRCMRFDFKLVPMVQIANLIKNIYDELGKEYEEEAITAIARTGDGSVRDALSVADLCISTEGKLTYKDVLQVTGAADEEKLYKLCDSILSSEVDNVLSISNDIFGTGKSVGIVAKNLVECVRNIAICKSCHNANSILLFPSYRYNMIEEIAKKADSHRIQRVLEILSRIESDARYSSQPRTIFETAVIKASYPEADYNIDALIGRIASLEQELKEIKANGIVVEKKIEVKEEIIDTGKKEEIPQKQGEEVKPKEVVKEEELSKTVEKETLKKEEDSISEEVGGYEDYEAPIEEPFYTEGNLEGIDFVEEVKQDTDFSKKEDKSFGKLQEVDVITESTSSETPVILNDNQLAKIWGTVYRNLRRSNDVVSVQELNNVKGKRLEDTTLVIIAASEKQKERLEGITEKVLDSIRQFGVKMVKIEYIDENIEIDKVVDFFGKENTKIER